MEESEENHRQDVGDEFRWGRTRGIDDCWNVFATRGYGWVRGSCEIVLKPRDLGCLLVSHGFTLSQNIVKFIPFFEESWKRTKAWNQQPARSSMVKWGFITGICRIKSYNCNIPQVASGFPNHRCGKFRLVATGWLHIYHKYRGFQSQLYIWVCLKLAPIMSSSMEKNAGFLKQMGTHGYP